MHADTKLAIAIIIAFITYYALIGSRCPCPNVQASDDVQIDCHRGEANAALSHFVFYVGLGYAFPTWFWFWQGLGVLWEIVELYVHRNQWLLSYTGGCVHSDMIGKQEGNHLDRLIGIHPPDNHVWHPSVSDIAYNLIGFGVGVLASKVGKNVKY